MTLSIACPEGTVQGGAAAGRRRAGLCSAEEGPFGRRPIAQSPPAAPPRSR